MRFTPAYLQRSARQLDALATADSHLPYLRDLAWSLADPQGDWHATVSNVWDWLPTHYVAERDGDHWQDATETLSTGTGDCEDWAVVLAAMLKANGIDARIVATIYHVAVALAVPRWLGPTFGWDTYDHDGRTWLFLECTLEPSFRRSLPPGSAAGLVAPYLNTPYVQIA